MHQNKKMHRISNVIIFCDEWRFRQMRRKRHFFQFCDAVKWFKVIAKRQIFVSRRKTFSLNASQIGRICYLRCKIVESNFMTVQKISKCQKKSIANRQKSQFAMQSSGLCDSEYHPSHRNYKSYPQKQAAFTVELFPVVDFVSIVVEQHTIFGGSFKK